LFPEWFTGEDLRSASLNVSRSLWESLYGIIKILVGDSEFCSARLTGPGAAGSYCYYYSYYSNFKLFYSLKIEGLLGLF